MATVVNKITISTNVATPVAFVAISEGPNKVDINYNTGVTGTITPFQTTDISKTNFYKPVYIGGVQVVATSPGDSFIIYGPGFIGFKSESVVGGDIEIEIQNA